MTDSYDADEEVLLAFAVEPETDNATLERYLKAYPHLTDQLIDLSLDLRLQHATEEQTAPVDEAWVEASLAAFRAISSANASQAVVDPFENVTAAELVALRQAACRAALSKASAPDWSSSPVSQQPLSKPSRRGCAPA